MTACQGEETIVVQADASEPVEKKKKKKEEGKKEADVPGAMQKILIRASSATVE